MRLIILLIWCECAIMAFANLTAKDFRATLVTLILVGFICTCVIENLFGARDENPV